MDRRIVFRFWLMDLRLMVKSKTGFYLCFVVTDSMLLDGRIADYRKLMEIRFVYYHAFIYII